MVDELHAAAAGNRRPDARAPRRRARAAVPLALVAGGAVALAACGGGSAATSGTSASAAASRGSAPSGAARQGPPGVSGTIAQVGAGSMEVQSATSQTTVTWTPTTRFSQTVAATLASVAPGDCVTATGRPGAGASGSTPGVVAATRVVVTPAPSSGTCTSRPEAGGSSSGGRPGGFGGFGGGFAGGFAGGFRRGAGAGSAGTAPVTVSTATGTVTGVSGSTITVSGFSRTVTFTPGARPRGGSSAGRTRPPGAASPGPVATVTVTTGASTTFTTVRTGSPAVLAVGQCATAFGSQSSTGAVTATVVAVRPAPAGGCDAGPGRAASGAASA